MLWVWGHPTTAWCFGRNLCCLPRHAAGVQQLCVFLYLYLQWACFHCLPLSFNLMLTSQLNRSIIEYCVDLPWFVQIVIISCWTFKYICVHACVYVCVHMIACRKQVDIKCLLQIFSTLVFETIFWKILKPGVIISSTKWASQWASGISLSSPFPPQSWVRNTQHHPHVLCECDVARTLPNEPFL